MCVNTPILDCQRIPSRVLVNAPISDNPNLYSTAVISAALSAQQNLRPKQPHMQGTSATADTFGTRPLYSLNINHLG